jgi:hypothetical protein
MVRSGFLDAKSHGAMLALECDRAAAHHLARRADALMFWTARYAAVITKVLLLDDDTMSVRL